MKKNPVSDSGSTGLIKALLDMGHTSPFEHCVISMRIENISRACSLQLVRHRMASYTSSSQHYQNYKDYDCFVHSDLLDDEDIHRYHELAFSMYEDLLNSGVTKEEARMILPESAGVNLIMTINARSLINFFELRLCNRNVEEMSRLAHSMYLQCYDWFPELFKLIGPHCAMTGKCNQGKMSCGSPWTRITSE